MNARYLVTLRHVPGHGWSHSVKVLDDLANGLDDAAESARRDEVLAAIVFNDEPRVASGVTMQWFAGFGESAMSYLFTGGGLECIKDTVRLVIRERRSWENSRAAEIRARHEAGTTVTEVVT